MDDHDAALARRALLDHDRIGAGRNDPAGECGRLSCADGALERVSGRHLADQPEPRRDPGYVDRANGVAVHGGDVGGRLAARELAGEHAAVRLGERHRLGRKRLRPASTRASASATGISATAYSSDR